ncbi:hypothetical protein HK100_001675 [Physocladia obscura]|uniref:Uncharacterized protein n=1 Tax=Physocladia obscura TaxID=109957 RepID=A0AAD5XGB5_9FUNG|nr:hypothetical protein HK100_001675 [Physocladia obscura]
MAAKTTKKTPPGGTAKVKTDDAPPIKTGVYIFLDLSRYDGAYKELEGGGIVRHGEGKQSSAEYAYTGTWDMDKMCGKGRLEFFNGAVYDGFWKDNKFMGHGTYTWTNNSSLSGEWDRNRVNGPGKFTDENGQNWIGIFLNGTATGLSADLS